MKCNTPIDKWQDLMIRACKHPSSRSIIRFQKILARRCWMKETEISLEYILSFLSEILETWVPSCFDTKLEEMIKAMMPSEQWRFGLKRNPDAKTGMMIFCNNQTLAKDQHEKNREFLQNAIAVVVSRIALTKVKYFPGYSTPAYHRNAEKRLVKA